jgi:hypothetical protein
VGDVFVVEVVAVIDVGVEVAVLGVVVEAGFVLTLVFVVVVSVPLVDVVVVSDVVVWEDGPDDVVLLSTLIWSTGVTVVDCVVNVEVVVSVDSLTSNTEASFA